MVLTVRNVCINENVPPSTSKTSSQTRRRRRRVSGSRPSTTTSIAEQARRRRVEAVVAPQAESSTRTVSLPSVLARPEPCANTIPANLMAIGEDWLKEATVGYVCDQLARMGPDMLEAARLARPVDPIAPGPIPSTISLAVPTPSTCLPTHMFALYTTSPGSKPKLTFYPVHNVIFSAYCAFLPALPTSSVVQSTSSTQAVVNVPVIPLRLPSPGHFPMIHHYLYTRRATDLLARLLPMPPSQALLAQLSNSHSSPVDMSALKAYSQTLKANVHPSRIFKSLLDVNGVWKDTCALGILDELLWDTLDLAWNVLLHGLPKAQ